MIHFQSDGNILSESIGIWFETPKRLYGSTQGQNFITNPHPVAVRTNAFSSR